MAKKSRKETILVVDDSPDTLEVLHRSIEHMGFTVFSSERAQEAIEILKEHQVDLVITDYHMPFIGGLDLICHVRDNYRSTEVMMITGYASVEGAVEAIKAGAEEYLAKPFTDEELEQAIERSLEKLYIRVAKKSVALKDISKQYKIYGSSNSMRRVFDMIKKASSSDLPVHLSGEPGTEKELLARIIHYESERANHPFIYVNCRDIPESILENEVFGFVQTENGINNKENLEKHSAGSIIKPGFLELARRGTVFFDEISETSLAVQVKLLRVLSDNEIICVGDNTVRNVECRIMVSTSRDLIELAGKGLFREDLFFRLNNLNISLPPLRERGNDVIVLCREYITRECKKTGKSTIPEFSERAVRSLLDYDWPGNLVELDTLMSRLALKIENDLIEVSDLPGYMRYNLENENRLDKTLAEVEKDYIKEVLAKYNGNKTKAAAMLAIDRKTLREKLDR